MITPYTYYYDELYCLLIRTKHHKLFDAQFINKQDKWDRQYNTDTIKADIKEGKYKQLSHEEAVLEML